MAGDILFVIKLFLSVQFEALISSLFIFNTSERSSISRYWYSGSIGSKMIDSKIQNSCPTCGGPPTPQQEVEAESRPIPSSAVKSLTKSFESLEVKNPSQDAAASEPPVSPIKDIVNRNIDSSDDEVIPAPVVWPPPLPRVHEPILEDNDERFCLLPVK